MIKKILSILLLVFVASVATAQTPTPTPGINDQLEGHWKLDEGSGIIAADSSGNGYDGTLINGPVWTPGVYLGALQFNSSPADESVDIVSAPGLSGMSAFTISLWLNSSYSSYSRVFAKWGSGGKRSYLINLDTGGKIEIGLSSNGNNYYFIRSQSGIPANTWTMVTATYDGTAVKIYFNAVDMPVDNCSPGCDEAFPSAIASTSFPLQFSRDYDDVPTFPYIGIMDDVRLYRRKLSSTQVLELYNLPTPTPTPTVTPTSTATPTGPGVKRGLLLLHAG